MLSEATVTVLPFGGSSGAGRTQGGSERGYQDSRALSPDRGWRPARTRVVDRHAGPCRRCHHVQPAAHRGRAQRLDPDHQPGEQRRVRHDVARSRSGNSLRRGDRRYSRWLDLLGSQRRRGHIEPRRGRVPETRRSPCPCNLVHHFAGACRHQVTRLPLTHTSTSAPGGLLWVPWSHALHQPARR